jgi:hypothetical protein
MNTRQQYIADRIFALFRDENPTDVLEALAHLTLTFKQLKNGSRKPDVECAVYEELVKLARTSPRVERIMEHLKIRAYSDNHLRVVVTLYLPVGVQLAIDNDTIKNSRFDMIRCAVGRAVYLLIDRLHLYGQQVDSVPETHSMSWDLGLDDGRQSIRVLVHASAPRGCIIMHPGDWSDVIASNRFNVHGGLPGWLHRG